MKYTIVLFIVFPLYLGGVILTPLVEHINDIKQSRLVFTVSNPQKEPVACEFTILRLKGVTPTSEEREETDDFIFFPSQFILKAGEKKIVRVRYMKNQILDSESIYRIIAKELDVNLGFDTNTTGLKFRFSYEGLIFVAPKGLKPNLKIVSYSKKDDGLEIVVENIGNKSDVLCSEFSNLYFKIDSKEYKLSKKECIKANFRRVFPSAKHTYILKNFTTIPIEGNKIESLEIRK